MKQRIFIMSFLAFFFFAAVTTAHAQKNQYNPVTDTKLAMESFKDIQPPNQNEFCFTPKDIACHNRTFCCENGKGICSIIISHIDCKDESQKALLIDNGKTTNKKQHSVKI